MKWVRAFCFLEGSVGLWALEWEVQIDVDDILELNPTLLEQGGDLKKATSKTGMTLPAGKAVLIYESWEGDKWKGFLIRLARVFSLLSGGGKRFLQIVPTLTSSGSFNKGSSTIFQGSGFIESSVTVNFGATQVVDGGLFSNDGADVYGSAGNNTRIGVGIPAGGGALISGTTERGTSVSLSP